MNIYKHEGKGFYVGSCVIVMAEGIISASEIIRKRLDEMGLTDEKLDIYQVEVKDGVIYEYNGDY